ncbi:MAG: radical SAM protein [Elusimicrobia bacterium]|nr:radical SAM protein [Elusimicrobiota bacterium]
MSTGCDVLLINPPWTSKDDNIWHGIRAAMPPLSLLSIAAVLEKNGARVRVLDTHVEKLTAEQFKLSLREIRPKWVGITAMTVTSSPAHKMARLVKETLGDVPVVMGGVHAEALPAETLSNACVDVVVRGDGEETFWNIVQGHPRQDIRGISYRQGDSVVHNPPAPLITNLDALPFSAYHLVPMHKYYPSVGAYKRLPAINMLMTRGCPGTCTFCNSALTRLRCRSAELVVEEILQLKKKYGIREIQFYDDTFTVMRREMMKFCELMASKDVNVTWTCFARTDFFNEGTAKALKKAGCHQVMFGVEAGDGEILKNIRKDIDKEKTIRAVQIARDAGIESRATFIFGNVGETAQTMRNTLDFCLKLDPDLALFNISTAYPGTQLFKWAKETGCLKTEEWQDYELSGMLLRLPTVTEDEVLRFYQYAHKRFYGRPKAVLRRLRRISNLKHFKDAVSTFLYIMFRHKLGSRIEVRRDWIDLKKADYFDYVLQEKDPLWLTTRLRESELPPAQRLIPLASARPSQG